VTLRIGYIEVGTVMVITAPTHTQATLRCSLPNVEIK